MTATECRHESLDGCIKQCTLQVRYVPSLFFRHFTVDAMTVDRIRDARAILRTPCGEKHRKHLMWLNIHWYYGYARIGESIWEYEAMREVVDKLSPSVRYLDLRLPHRCDEQEMRNIQQCLANMPQLQSCSLYGDIEVATARLLTAGIRFPDLQISLLWKRIEDVVQFMEELQVGRLRLSVEEDFPDERVAKAFRGHELHIWVDPAKPWLHIPDKMSLWGPWATYRAKVLAMFTPGPSALDKFLQRDGDHAVKRRILRFLSQQPNVPAPDPRGVLP